MPIPKNIFNADEQILRAFDSRLKKLERTVANLVMTINAQIGQAKFVRDRAGGNATQVSVPGAIGGDGAGDVEAVALSNSLPKHPVLDHTIEIAYRGTDGNLAVKKGKMPVIVPAGNLSEDGFDIVTPVLDAEATVWATRAENHLADESGTMVIVIKDGIAYPVAVIA